jgi:hypothetical protein
MAKFLSSAPVLFVRDVLASAEHYRDTMGFRFDRFYGDPPSFVILGRYAPCHAEERSRSLGHHPPQEYLAQSLGHVLLG